MVLHKRMIYIERQGHLNMSKMKTPLLPGESLIDIQRCNRLGKGAMVWGGNIFVTNRRIIFETNEMNSKLKEITDIIDVNDVREYAYADHFCVGWMVPIPGLTQDKSVSIRTTNETYRFTPKNVRQLMQDIQQACPYAVFGKKDSYTEAVKETVFGEKNADVGEKMEAGVKAGKEMLGNLSGKILGSGKAQPQPTQKFPNTQNSPEMQNSSEMQTPPQSAVSSPVVLDAVSEIKKYKELFDMGAITEEEFEAKKKQLLGQ